MLDFRFKRFCVYLIIHRTMLSQNLKFFRFVTYALVILGQRAVIMMFLGVKNKNIDTIFIFVSDLSWSRFGSLPLRKSRLAKENGVSLVPKPKHKDIQQWLKDLELEEYAALFTKYHGVEDLLEFSESDLRELGVKRSSHRATIISSLTLLRAKYHGKFLCY